MTYKLIMFLLPLLGIISTSSCSLENEDEEEMGNYQDLAGNIIDVSGTITLEYPGKLILMSINILMGLPYFKLASVLQETI